MAVEGHPVQVRLPTSSCSLCASPLVAVRRCLGDQVQLTVTRRPFMLTQGLEVEVELGRTKRFNDRETKGSPKMEEEGRRGTEMGKEDI